jgi:hypothetical protein
MSSPFFENPIPIGIGFFVFMRFCVELIRIKRINPNTCGALKIKRKY